MPPDFSLEETLGPPVLGAVLRLPAVVKFLAPVAVLQPAANAGLMAVVLASVVGEQATFAGLAAVVNLLGPAALVGGQAAFVGLAVVVNLGGWVASVGLTAVVHLLASVVVLGGQVVVLGLPAQPVMPRLLGVLSYPG